MVFLKKLEIKGNAAEIINYLFQTLLVLYLSLLLIEQIWPTTVSSYLNLNYLLFIVIVFGILDVFSEKNILKKEKPTKFDYVFVFALGIVGFFIIKYKTAQLGWLSWIISIIAAILIFLLSLLILEEDEDQKEIKKNKKPLSLKQKILIFSLIVLLLFLISFSLAFFTNLNLIESLRIVFGSVYVLFLPGFIISYIFFPKTKDIDSEEKDSIDWIERIALSFALSIAIVPLTVFYLNLLGVKINLLNSFLTILGIILVSSLILYLKKKSQHKYS